MSETRTTSAGRILTNGVWNTSAAVVTGLITFLLVPFLLRTLGERIYGVWVLIGSIFAYSTILHFGLSSAINRYIPLGLARGDDDEIRRVASTGTAFFSMVALAIASLTLAVYFNLDRWFNIPAEAVVEARRSVLVVGFFLSATVTCQTFGAVLSGYQRYDLTAKSRLFMSVIRAVAVVILTTSGGGLLGLAFIFGLTEFGMNVIQLLFARRLMPRRSISAAAVDRSLLKEMVGYGFNTFLYGAGAVIAYEASELVIGVFLRPEDVARYSVAATGILVIATLIDSVSAALKPAVSDLDARSETQRIRALSLLSQKYTLLLIVPSTAFLIIMGGEFLQVWTGVVDPEVTTVLALLAIAQAFRLAQHSNFLVLVGKGEHRFFGFAVLLVGLATVSLSVLGIGVLRTGLMGAGVASLLAWGIVCGIIVPLHVNRRLAVSWHERWTHVVKPVSAACVPCLGVLAVWEYVHPPSSWTEILAVVAVVAGLTALATWRAGLDARERQRFLRFLQPDMPRTLG